MCHKSMQRTMAMIGLAPQNIKTAAPRSRSLFGAVTEKIRHVARRNIPEPCFLPGRRKTGIEVPMVDEDIQASFVQQSSVAWLHRDHLIRGHGEKHLDVA